MFRFHPLPEATRAVLTDGGLDPDDVAALVRRAVAEDLAGGVDVTSTATVPVAHRSTGHFATRAEGVLAGLPVAVAVVQAVCGPDVVVDWVRRDGDRLSAGDVVARIAGPTRRLLTAERTALNLLCHLSGIATLTRRWADALGGTRARVRDTRKTTPGLRALEKYAVRCGGGLNHRLALSDAALVKDNHVVAAGGVAEAFALVRAFDAAVPVEVEVDTLDGLAEAIAAGADLVLLDNFSVAQLQQAVELRDRLGRPVELEASGGLTLETAAAVGATGVDYIAVGELTHSARILDLGLDLLGATG